MKASGSCVIINSQLVNINLRNTNKKLFMVVLYLSRKLLLQF